MVAMSEVTNEVMVLWRGKDYFCLSMKVGCGLVTLESCGSVDGCLQLGFV